MAYEVDHLQAQARCFMAALWQASGNSCDFLSVYRKQRVLYIAALVLVDHHQRSRVGTRL